MKTISVLVLIASAGSTFADVLSASHTALHLSDPRPVNALTPTGTSFGFSLFATADAGSGTGSGGVANILSGIVPSFGTTTFIPSAIGSFSPGVNVSSSVTPLGGDDFRIIIEASTPNLFGFLGTGVTLNGFVVNGLGLDLGDLFNSPSFPAPTDALDFGASVSILAQTVSISDPLNGPLGTFALSGTGTPGAGGGITDYADQIVLTLPPGASLFAVFPINRAVFTIDYRVVPAPATAFSLCIVLVAAGRRRR